MGSSVFFPWINRYLGNMSFLSLALRKIVLDCVHTVDPEYSVQEQALALVRNFVDGPMNYVEYAFAEDGIIFEAVGRRLRGSSKAEIGIQVSNNF